MQVSQYHLRPYASGQHARWVSRCILLDAYLFSNASKLYLIFEVRLKANDVMPSTQLGYVIERDAFGLFSERRMYGAPSSLGVQVRVDDLKALNSTQRAQLRRLVVLLAMSVRAGLESGGHGPRYSIKLHCLTPAPCAPLDGIRNEYATSGRAARDAELARRARDKALDMPE